MDGNGFHNYREQIVLEIRRSIRSLGGAASMDMSEPGAAYQRLEQLGAAPDLLATVGSWKDTLDDEEVLRLLKKCNQGKSY